MILLPFDFILTVGTAVAVFVLGCSVWARHRGARGNGLFALLAVALTIWTSADWILHLESGASSLHLLVWKLVFYISVCFSPIIALEAAAAVAHRSFTQWRVAASAVSLASYGLIAFGLVRTAFGVGDSFTSLVLSSGAWIGVALYLVSFFVLAAFVYPIFFSHQTSILQKRRAVYAVLLLAPFLVAGGLQLLSGPIPIGLVMPILGSFFVLIGLLSFLRASFLDIEFGSLEAFFVPLLSFSVVVVLRAQDPVEFVASFIGSFAVGAYGYLAIRTVREERTRREMLEQANRQLRRLEQARLDFVDMVAHQLRTPLSGIRGTSSMLKDGDFGVLPEKAKTAVAQISDVCDRVLELSETFLNASRVGLGMYTSKETSIHPAVEITAIAEELRRAAESKGLKFEIEIEKNLPASAALDVEVLKNALFNLIDNAIKYTSHGGVRIQARSEEEEIVVSVRDTGQGMTKDEVHSLFQKFHRGDAAREHDQDGTGLGLFVVRGLTDAAKGSIEGTSEGPGQGSTFTLRLPMSRVDEAHAHGVA